MSDQEKLKSILLELAHRKDTLNIKKVLKEDIKSLEKDSGYPPYIFPEAIREKIDDLDISGVSLLLIMEPSLLKYQETGEINQDLLPLFDQNGNWYGIGLERDIFGKLSKEIIPKSQLRDTKSGILFSSFVANDEDPIGIPYTKILGNLDAEESPEISALNLEFIGGHANLGYCTKLNFPELKEVGGDLGIANVDFVQLPTLQKIRGSLDARSAQSFDAKNLVHVIGGLDLYGTSKIQCPQLEFVGESLFANWAKNIDLKALNYVGKDLSFDDFAWAKTTQLRKLRQSTQSWVVDEKISKELEAREQTKLKLEKIKGQSLHLE